MAVTAEDDNNVSLLVKENRERCIKELAELRPLRIAKDAKKFASVLIPMVELQNHPGCTGTVDYFAVLMLILRAIVARNSDFLLEI